MELSLIESEQRRRQCPTILMKSAKLVMFGLDRMTILLVRRKCSFHICICFFHFKRQQYRKPGVFFAERSSSSSDICLLSCSDHLRPSLKVFQTLIMYFDRGGSYLMFP